MFSVYKIENGRMNVPEPEYFDVGSTDISVGETLVLSSGKLVKNTTAPTHVSLANATKGATAVPVCRIEKNQVYAVSCAKSPADFKVGAKLTVSSDGLEVDSASDSGIVTIVDTLGAKAAGDTILVRF